MATTTDTLTASLGILEDAPATLEDIDTLAAAVRELSERIAAGTITRDQRTDIGGDIIALAETVLSFGMRVLA